jgi:penicillin-binding protein 1A
VQKAFVAAEDRRFFEHHGVDERGIIRAFIGNFANPGRPQGGSTITQQVVKNLLVGDEKCLLPGCALWLQPLGDARFF